MHEELLGKIYDINKELGYTGFVMAQNNINKLLNLIATDRTLKKLLERTSNVVNYSLLFKESMAEPNSVKLPDTSEGVFVLFTGLMHGFSCGKVDFIKFLQTRFKSNSIEYSFKLFYEKVMKAYFEAIVILLEKSEKQLNVESPDTQIIVPKIALEQILNIISDISRVVMSDAGMSEQKGRDCLDLLDGMEVALATNNLKFVKLIWFAIKYIMTAKIYTSLVKALETILINYSMI